jgi:hypothetical protein
MRVVVKFHHSARADYLAWQTRLRDSRSGNAEVARIHAEELIRELEQHNGMPPGAKFRADVDPPSWIWRFSADTWVRYVLRDRRSGLWGSSVREIIVTAVANQPPS